MLLLHVQDLAGWKKIISKLGNKCLIIADSTLQKGQLPLVMQTREVSGSPRLSPRDDSGGSGRVEGEREPKVEGGEGEDVCVAGVEGLPCAALTWEHSLSSTMDRVDHLKGTPIISGFVAIQVVSDYHLLWMCTAQRTPSFVWHMVHA